MAIGTPEGRSSRRTHLCGARPQAPMLHFRAPFKDLLAYKFLCSTPEDPDSGDLGWRLEITILKQLLQVDAHSLRTSPSETLV
ncbi:hypothetical protein J1605_018896 [Eschrichtius robustus]|uniref:Uncharacterized protein n=1 Tax=Eschrichtius robustus TaxID=9764 RepID=A0AB34HTK2_ESCRO|nr:hypothetical protein J1605_018896 [Eschrichtius robustus]